jgi:hypothetical protein
MRHVQIENYQVRLAAAKEGFHVPRVRCQRNMAIPVGGEDFFHETETARVVIDHNNVGINDQSIHDQVTTSIGSFMNIGVGAAP